jgi:hypothetical protein
MVGLVLDEPQDDNGNRMYDSEHYDASPSIGARQQAT